MNKFYLVLLFLTIVSCSKHFYTIGMDEETFLRQNRSAISVEASTEITVYKIKVQPFGVPARVTFYYFAGGKLVGYDEGVRRPDISIDVHNH